jgi:hypothetical protein
MTSANQSWNLESFVDALVVELDKTRETLSVKAINNPLSYSVKDMAVDLQIFPTYDGGTVKFVTAQPGETGSSKLSIQLSSITDRQVRESSKRPTRRDDVKIEEMELDEDVKRELRKVGVTSVGDLDRMEKKDVNLESVVKKRLNYSDLADAIRSSRRSRNPPRVREASLSRDSAGDYRMEIVGEELATDPSFDPVAVVNGKLVPLLSHAKDQMTFACPEGLISSGDNEMIMVLDPYSVVRLNVQRLEHAHA